MKTILKSLFVFAMLFNSYAQDSGNWKILNEGGNFRIIDFINEDIGWIGGGRTLLKTEDGGETWHSLPIEENYDMQIIDFIDETVGYAVADDTSGNVILKSQDGGFTWSIQEVFTDSIINALYVVDENCVYAIGRNSNGSDTRQGLIWKTFDGGTSWNVISPDLTNKTFNSVSFTDTEVGIITGYDSNIYKVLILKTVDGGNTWDEITIPEFSNLYDFKFINDSTGYFVAETENDDLREYFLCATTDTFNTWIIKTRSPNQIQPYFVRNDDNIFAVMTDSVSINIMISIDGGSSWIKRGSIQSGVGDINQIYFSNQNIGYAIGSRRSGPFVLKSIDTGDSWKFFMLSYLFLNVYFLDKDTGFASGGYAFGSHGPSILGDIFKTDDGGKTWSLSSETSDFVWGCFFVDELTGYAIDCGNDGAIYKTVNRGNNWNKIYNTENDSIRFYGIDLFFFDENFGWSVGIGCWPEDTCGAFILGTTDGGDTWNPIWRYANTDEYFYRLNSIHVINTTAWTVGESGLMVKYTDQDSWQPQPAITDLPLQDVFFTDEQHGWITGGYLNDQDLQSVLFKTSNGGQTWNETRFDEYLINDMYFADSLHGWAVGGDTSHAGGTYPLNSGHGIILKTADGGFNWIPQVEGLKETLTSLYFKDGVGWAVGGNGLVLRTDNWTTWIDQNTGKKYPTKYQLLQNYPNPFNPATKIKFFLPKTEKVKIEIYNLLGQKISTILNKQMEAGNHEIEFNAQNLSSGVYFYRLETKTGFIQTKKLVVLK